MSNKLNGLTLNQAVLIRDALETIDPCSDDDNFEQTVEDREYLLGQLYSIVNKLEKRKKS